MDTQGRAKTNTNVRELRVLRETVMILREMTIGVEFAQPGCMPAQAQHRYTASPSQTDPPHRLYGCTCADHLPFNFRGRYGSNTAVPPRLQIRGFPSGTRPHRRLLCMRTGSSKEDIS